MRPRLALTTLLLLAVAPGLGACKQSGEEGLPALSPEVESAIDEAGQTYPERRKRKIVLVGFDSCDPDLVEDMIRKGQLPHFARLKREGASGKLASIPPYLSPVVWTTIATGMRPDRHGILDFVAPQGAGKPVPVTAEMRQADTVWEVLSRCGVSTGVVGWLVSYPAEPLPGGFMVTEQVGKLGYEYLHGERDIEEGRTTYPSALATEIAADKVDVDDITLSAMRPFAQISEEELAAHYDRNFSRQNKVGNLRLTLATAETFRNIGTRLMDERQPQFLAVYFEAMDVLSHLFMPYAPPKAPGIELDEFKRFRSAIEANYRWHDRVLGEFMERCDDDTTLILVSDHGFKSGRFRLTDGSEFHEKTGAMWHRPYGTFFAWGDGIVPGKRVNGATVYDIAPTVLAAMGYPVPRDMAGSPLVDAFEGGLPAVQVDTYFGEARRERVATEFQTQSSSFTGLTNEQKEQMAKLESLGYTSGNRSDAATGELNLGSIYLSRGQPELALEQFRAVLARMEADPKSAPAPRVHFSIADALIAMSRLRNVTDDEVAKLLAEASEHVDAAEGLAQKSAAMLRAAQKMGRAPADAPEDPNELVTAMQPELLGFRARIALRHGDLDTALHHARELRRLKPSRYSAHSLYGSIQADLAEQALERAGAAQTPEDKLRELDLAAQHHREAVIGYERALELEPNQFHALKEVARLRLSAMIWIKNDTRKMIVLLEKARAELEAALELIPKSSDALNNYTIALMRSGIQMRELGRRQESQEYFAKAGEVVAMTVERYPNYSKAWANKAYLEWQTGRIEEAFESAVKVRENAPGYRLNADLLAIFASRGLKLPEPAPTKQDEPAPTEQDGSPED